MGELVIVVVLIYCHVAHLFCNARGEAFHTLTVSQDVQRARDHRHFLALCQHHSRKVSAHTAALFVVAADVGKLLVKMQIVVESDDGEGERVELFDYLRRVDGSEGEDVHASSRHFVDGGKLLVLVVAADLFIDHF